jgi:outer membrane receptor protein involved in Fe transport
MRVVLRSFILALLFFTSQLLAQTGKITGYVKDASGEAVVGANIVVVGTNQGAAAAADGYYVILNIAPGTYTLKCSSIGYAPESVKGIRVSGGQTTEIPFTLKDQSLQTSEIVVTAKTPVVQKDVSGSTANLSKEQFENLPVANVSSVVGLQAGADGLSIRGGSVSETAFMVDGLSIKNGRSNSPFSAISMTAIEDIQIQTGGFNAEYGNIRSGLVSVVTSEGKTNKYNFAFSGRMLPATKKYFGEGPTSNNAYWVRPFVDDAVCWTGTSNGAWDTYTQRQYTSFGGWNAISQKLLQDNDPTNDLTPEGCQKLFKWQHRKDTKLTKPDYDYDASLSGPVPFVSQALGNLRFLASIRGSRTMYMIPLATDYYDDYTAQLKLTSDIGQGKKLTIEGLTSQSNGTTNSRTGAGGLFSTPGTIAYALSYSKSSYGDSRIFSSDYWSPSTEKIGMIAAKFTNAISQYTFYEAKLTAVRSKYETNPGRVRNKSSLYEIVPGYFTTEAPYGFCDSAATGIDGNLRMGVGMSDGRDTSVVTDYTGKFDYTTQLDKYNQVKAGAELKYTDNNVNYGSYDKYLPSNNSHYVWHTFPLSGALYVQDKIEYEMMVANIGLRLDYSNANTDWYVITDNYSSAFAADKVSNMDVILKKEPTKGVVSLSPRLGVAFPITESSKLFFNYGHFRQLPDNEELYMRRVDQYSGKLTYLANPNLAMEKTVAYELGYEQSFLEEYKVRATGYYKDVTLQTRDVEYISRDGKVDVFRPSSDSYEDIRGFELTLEKNRGMWVQGMINYNYAVSTSGYFNLKKYYQNSSDQRTYETNTTENYQEKPHPQPEAKCNIDFFTPSSDFGPEWKGIGLLTDWRLSVTASWSAGSYTTWYGGSGDAPKGVQDNLQWRDNQNVSLRISKSFRIADKVNLQFYADITNVFNHKTMSTYGFVDSYDYNYYMQSLHLKDGIVTSAFGYVNIPGEDKPGDYNKAGYYQPIRPEANIENITAPTSGLIYYDVATRTYQQYDATSSKWQEVDKNKMNKILDDKAYIDMPNQSWLSFLNPRYIYWGLKVSVEL